MPAPTPNSIVWHTSSYSAGHGACVEVAPGPDAVLIRDSKNRTGPALSLSPTTWQTFLTTLPH
ncbi:MAG: DUF397 domain-containing protein [Pseudonocardiaceae bacterium]